MKKRKYVIVSYRTSYGGVIVLHNLAHLLNELGQDARVIYFRDLNYPKKHRAKFWIKWIIYSIKISIKSVLEKILGPKHLKGYFDVSISGIKRKYTPFVSRDTIVVYPECVFGNPLRSKNVVRWLLFFNSLYKRQDGKTIGYDKSDLFFSYREVFNDWSLNPKCRICCTPYFDLDKYKQYNFKKRYGKCYVLRKGIGRVNKEDCNDGIVIDDLPEDEKIRVFNECEYCISYDTQTAYSKLAAICGCISVVIPEDGKSRKDYRSAEDDNNGVAFGFCKDEIEFAKKTRYLAKKTYERANCESREYVKKIY